MGTYNHSYKSTYNLLTGLRGLVSRVGIRVISTMNLQVEQRRLRAEYKNLHLGSTNDFTSASQVSRVWATVWGL